MRITYKTERAEHGSLADNSADLITVAQARRWFDFDRFYAEATLALKPNAVMAVWAYGQPVMKSEIDHVIRHFHYQVIDDYWQPENKLIDKGYNTIPFPFQRFAPPGFTIRKDIDLSDLPGLVRSWSAVQRLVDKERHDPVVRLEYELMTLWGKHEGKRSANWQLILLLGRNANK